MTAIDPVRAQALVERAEQGAGRKDVKLVVTYLRAQIARLEARAKLFDQACGMCGSSADELVEFVEWRAERGRQGKRNMYGCLPCPGCGSVYRCPYRRGAVFQIECDECGLNEVGVRGDDPEFGEGGVWNAGKP